MTKADKAFIDAMNKSMKPLLAELSVTQKELRTLLIASVENPTKNAAAWNKLRKEVDQLYADMSYTFSAWSKTEIPVAYRTSVTAITKAIEADAAILATAQKSLPAMISQTAPLSALMALEANDTFLAALNAGRTNVIRFTRATQQVLLTESQINSALIKGLLDGGNLGKASKVLSGDFWSKMYSNIKGDQFIQAGKYRYTPDYYAQLVARTKFHEAQSMAALTTAKNYDTNLVQVSDHNTKTEICIPYEGNIYSIDGKGKYPPLEDTPPYHPNCLHLLYPVFESALEGAA